MRKAILLFTLALTFLLLAFLTNAQTVSIRDQFAQAVYPAFHQLHALARRSDASTATPPPIVRTTATPEQCFVQWVEPPIVVCPDLGDSEPHRGRNP